MKQELLKYENNSTGSLGGVDEGFLTLNDRIGFKGRKFPINTVNFKAYGDNPAYNYVYVFKLWGLTYIYDVVSPAFSMQLVGDNGRKDILLEPLPQEFRPATGAKEFICQGSSGAIWECQVTYDGHIKAGRYRNPALSNGVNSTSNPMWETISTTTWMPFNISYPSQPYDYIEPEPVNDKFLLTEDDAKLLADNGIPILTNTTPNLLGASNGLDGVKISELPARLSVSDNSYFPTSTSGVTEKISYGTLKTQLGSELQVLPPGGATGDVLSRKTASTAEWSSPLSNQDIEDLVGD